MLHDESCLVSFTPTLSHHAYGGVVHLARMMGASTEVSREIKASAPEAGRGSAAAILWLT